MELSSLFSRLSLFSFHTHLARRKETVRLPPLFFFLLPPSLPPFRRTQKALLARASTVGRSVGRQRVPFVFSVLLLFLFPFSFSPSPFPRRRRQQQKLFLPKGFSSPTMNTSGAAAAMRVGGRRERKRRDMEEERSGEEGRGRRRSHCFVRGAKEENIGTKKGGKRGGYVHKGRTCLPFPPPPPPQPTSCRETKSLSPYSPPLPTLKN